MLLLIVAAAVAQPPAQAPASAQASKRPPLQAPAEPALTQQIMKADAELFDLFFSGACDVPRLRGMLAEGAEFYHDRKGLVSSDGFVAEYRKDCESRVSRKGMVRRELVAGSLSVSPITSYGAFQTGEHHFYVRSSADSAERLVDRRRFAVLWRLGDDGKWRLSHIVDYRSPSVR
jgi:hypothetical protein